MKTIQETLLNKNNAIKKADIEVTSAVIDYIGNIPCILSFEPDKINQYREPIKTQVKVPVLYWRTPTLRIKLKANFSLFHLLKDFSLSINGKPINIPEHLSETITKICVKELQRLEKAEQEIPIDE